MIAIALMAITLSPIAATPTQANSCGYSKVPRIVGGTDASAGEFPWMASILLHGSHYCGATIIHSRWIITAAHCMHRHSKDFFKVRVGEYNLNEFSGHENDITVEKVFVHPKFVLARYLNDLALIKLSKDIEWDQYKQPICLPEIIPDSYVNSTATVAGWGWLDDPQKGGNRASILQKLDLVIVDRTKCQKWYHQAGKVVTISSNHMCAGYKEGGRDSCQGDSGGPLMLRNSSKYELIGVVSAGIGCARPLLPGLYTQVGNFLNWIQETMQ